MERTLLFVKPDGVRRRLVSEIMLRCERKGWRLAGLKRMRITPELAAQHYAEHRGKPFFSKLIEYVTSGPIVAMVWDGHEVVTMVRKMMGATNPVDAAPGTIRGDFARDVTMNIVHSSDSPDSAVREIALFFKPEELSKE